MGKSFKVTSMEETLLKYLIDTLKPKAIILHGSRARGMARELSDWDYILLYNRPTIHKSGRAVVEGQNIEYSIVVMPVENIFETFSTKLQSAKVAFEENQLGTHLLEQAAHYYSQGVHWDTEKINGHKLWFQGRIDGMKNYTDNPVIFYKYYSDLYDRVTNYWYWLLQHSHSQPMYVAIGEIAEKDPIYHNLVLQLAAEGTSLTQKVTISESIRDHLFNSH